MDIPDYDLDELQQKSDDAQNQKAMYGTLGAIAKGFDNVPSSYNLLYGKGQPTGQSSQIFDSLAKSVPDPWERQKRTYEMYKQAKDAQALDRQSQDETAERDPDSQKSQNARSIYGPVLKRGGVSDEDLANMSSQDIQGAIKGVINLEDIKNKSEDRKFKTAMMGQNLDLKKAAADAKSTEKQDKAYTDLRNKVESFRGNQAVAQAATGVLNSEKALDLARRKDPNTWTRQDVELFANEVAKVASGGVPTESGIRHLVPDSYASELSGFLQKITNEPQPAKAAKLIQGKIDYLKDMMATSKQVLHQYQANIAKGYLGRVSQDQKDEFLADYPHLAPYLSGQAKSVIQKDSSGDYGTRPNNNSQPPINMSKAANKPKTVIQNGHMYILNEQTGEYE